MSQNQIQLETSSILSVPLQSYSKNFSFIVNGEEFKTSQLTSDLLSPKICQIHSNDPTCQIFTINTSHKGDFTHILNLLNFQKYDILENELPFIIEVIQILENESIKLQEPTNYPMITTENVFQEIKKHEKFNKFFYNRFTIEIDFISSHFYELCETKANEFLNLSIDTIYSILNNKNLRLKTEDQLLKFVNNLYEQNVKYSILYETVLFTNASSESMHNFVEIYDFNCMTHLTWQNLSQRLEHEIETNKASQKERYKITQEKKKEELKRGTVFEAKTNNKFEGIINYLRILSNNQIEKEMNITASGVNSGYNPINAVIYEDKKKYFDSTNQPNSWICFEFKKHKIIPSSYTIRSIDGWGQNSDHPKSWIIECSNDQNSWEIVDDVKDCNYLNGSYLVHTFEIKNQTNKEYKYLRMRSTGPDCSNDSHWLSFDSFEVYGTLI